MRFTKMQGLGNDYIYLDCRLEQPADLPELARRLSDRHFGVGGDGVICLFPSRNADIGMRIFNADGSEGKMCGNGIRCLGKYVYDKKIVSQNHITVETKAGIRTVELQIERGEVHTATVDMGEPEVQIPRPICVRGQPFWITPVSMGNPHAVLFLDQIEDLNLSDLGPEFESHPSFPGRTNTEFVEILAPDRLNMRVWERGSGETLACGTGACAALAAAVSSGRAERHVTVVLRGGLLQVSWPKQKGPIYMTGPAVTVFEGEWRDFS